MLVTSILNSLQYCTRPNALEASKMYKIQNSGFYYSKLFLKKVPTFYLSVTLSNLNQFSKFLHCWKFGTKHIRHYPPHLRYVRTVGTGN